MIREEYLESLNENHTESNQTEIKHVMIETYEDYINTRKAIEEFESTINFSKYLTANDYAAFDANFQKALDELLYTDEDYCERDCIDRTVYMMNADNWVWAFSGNQTFTVPTKEQFIKKIQYCYEQCLKSNRPHITVGTGGVVVSIDIIDHSVHISFDTLDAMGYDENEIDI